MFTCSNTKIGVQCWCSAATDWIWDRRLTYRSARHSINGSCSVKGLKGACCLAEQSWSVVARSLCRRRLGRHWCMTDLRPQKHRARERRPCPRQCDWLPGGAPAVRPTVIAAGRHRADLSPAGRASGRGQYEISACRQKATRRPKVGQFAAASVTQGVSATGLTDRCNSPALTDWPVTTSADWPTTDQTGNRGHLPPGQLSPRHLAHQFTNHPGHSPLYEGANWNNTPPGNTTKWRGEWPDWFVNVRGLSLIHIPSPRD